MTSGLFPSGPPRPVLREPLPVRPWAVLIGLIAAGIWLLAFGQLAADFKGYAWWTLAGGVLAWIACVTLARYGDRGIAAGIALAVAIGWSTTTVAVAATWVNTGTFPLW